MGGTKALSAPYQYMFTKLHAVADALNDNLLNLSDILKEKLNIDDFERLDQPSQVGDLHTNL